MPASTPARTVLPGPGRALGAALRSSSWRDRVREGLLLLAVAAAGALQLALGDDELLPVPGPLVVLGMLLVAVAVAARRWWPTAAAVTAVLLLAVPVLSAPFVPVVVFAAARHLPPARLWSALGAAAGVLLVAERLLQLAEPLPLVLASWAAGVALLVVAPAACGALVGRRRPAGRLLREREQHLHRTRAQIAERARRAELARITGEMHDMLGHRLALLSLHAGALEVGAARLAPAVSAQAEVVRGIAGTALAELRQILEITRPGPPGSGDGAAGTRADVHALVDGSCAAGLAVTAEWVGVDTADADPRVRQTVHRVVREGLTNVHKHAPTAGGTRVTVVVTEDRCRVEVANGAPRAAASGDGTGMGLAGLQQRAALLGGTCHGRSRPDGGFVLALDLPLPPPEHAARPGADRPGAPEESEPLPEVEVMTAPRLAGVVAVAALIVVPVVVAVVVLTWEAF